MNRKAFFLVALLVGLGSFAQADGSVNFFNRMVYKAAQAYPLDPAVYTGWGPDWAGAGNFEQMTLGFSKGPVGFALDTQFNGASDIVLHVNSVQGWYTLVPDTLKVYAGKLRMDDYRWLTTYTDKGMGRFQVPDNWGAAAVTYSPKGTGLRASVLVPTAIGTASPSHIDASSTAPNKPGNMTLTDSLALCDVALAWDDKATGLRLVAGTVGDTSAGGAYGSTGSDLGAGFGSTDPQASSRSWYGGVGWTGPQGLNLWTGGTWWADPQASTTKNQHVEALAQAQWGAGDLKLGFDAVADWDQGAAEGTVTTQQVVNNLTSGTYSVTQGPVTVQAYLGATYKLKAAGLDLVPGLALGGGNRDRSTGMATYTFPTGDKFVEARATLAWNPTGLTVGFDDKFDLDAKVSTWVVPVTFTFSSY